MNTYVKILSKRQQIKFIYSLCYFVINITFTYYLNLQFISIVLLIYFLKEIKLKTILHIFTIIFTFLMFLISLSRTCFFLLQSFCLEHWWSTDLLAISYFSLCACKCSLAYLCEFTHFYFPYKAFISLYIGKLSQIFQWIWNSELTVIIFQYFKCISSWSPSVSHFFQCLLRHICYFFSIWYKLLPEFFNTFLLTFFVHQLFWWV